MAISRFIHLFFPLIFVIIPALEVYAAQPQDHFTFILPAPAIHQSLQSILPLPLEPDKSMFDGTLAIDSIDKLAIHDQMIALHGVITGKDIAMNTEIAGRKIKLKLGQVILPLSCDLHLRYDQVGQQLFVTPSFKTSENSNGNGQALLPLLAALENREYPVDLRKLQGLNLNIGSRNLEIPLQPVQVTADNDQLILSLRPQKNKSR